MKRRGVIVLLALAIVGAGAGTRAGEPAPAGSRLAGEIAWATLWRPRKTRPADVPSMYRSPEDCLREHPRETVSLDGRVRDTIESAPPVRRRRLLQEEP